MLKYFLFGLFLAFIGYIWYTPSPVSSCSYTLPDPPEFKGSLEVNNLLTNSKLLFEDYGRVEGEYHSPLRAEAFEEDGKGGFYTGLGDGRVVHIVNEGGRPPNFKLVPIIRTGRDSPLCGTEHMEYYCGRPLGLHIHPKTNTLFIADTLGLLELNLETKELKTLVSQYKGSPVTFPNSIAINKEGKVYFTDSSTKFNRSVVLYELIESCANGRLFSYDPVSGELELLLKDLFFPNGIQLTPEEDALIFAESTRFRLLKYYLKGTKKGKVEVFLECPGLPDNIKYSHESDVYWVGLATIRPNSSLFELSTSYPRIRDLVSKLFSKEKLFSLITKYGIIIAVNHKGQIVKSLQDPHGSISNLSEVVEQDGYLYIGSWKNDAILQVDATRYLPLKN